MTGAIDSPLIGAWVLVSHCARSDGGAIVHEFGEEPVGTLIYASDGYMGAQLIQVDSIPSGEQARLQSFSGVFRLTKTGFSFDVRASNDPKGVGKTNERRFTIGDADPQTLRIEWTQQGLHYSVVWKRLAKRSGGER